MWCVWRVDDAAMDKSIALQTIEHKHPHTPTSVSPHSLDATFSPLAETTSWKPPQFNRGTYGHDHNDEHHKVRTYFQGSNCAGASTSAIPFSAIAPCLGVEIDTNLQKPSQHTRKCGFYLSKRQTYPPDVCIRTHTHTSPLAFFGSFALHLIPFASRWEIHEQIHGPNKLKCTRLSRQ